MHHRISAGLCAWIILLFSALGTTANADVLVLENGDRITGDIKRIWDDKVTIEPAYADEFEVDLDVIAFIRSQREFDVEFYDGRSFEAQLAGSNEEGEQVFKVEDEVVAAPLEAMLELNELEEAFDWEADIEAAMNVNRGNTDSTTGKLRAYGSMKINDHRHIGDLQVFREKLAQVRTKEQDLLKYSYNFLYSDEWFFTADTSFERDPISLLDSRVIASAGVGRDIWMTPRRALSIKLGAGYQAEEIDAVKSEGSVVSWGLTYKQDLFGEDVGVFHRHTIVRNITGRDNTSYKTSTGVSYEMNDLLETRVTLDYNYETNPAENATAEDIAFLFGLALEF